MAHGGGSRVQGSGGMNIRSFCTSSSPFLFFLKKNMTFVSVRLRTLGLSVLRSGVHVVAKASIA